VFEHGLGQAIGLELVGMVFAQLAAIGLGHLFIRGLRVDFQNLIGRGELHAAAGWRLSASAGTAVAATRSPTRPKLLATNAQYGFHVCQLDSRYIEQVGDSLNRQVRRPFHVHALERCAHLHFKEHTHQVGAIRAGLGELSHGGFQIEVRALAAREMGDGSVDLHARESQLRHHLARGGDLGLGDTPVGLGDVPHDFERGREEALADLEHTRGATRATYGRDALIVEVAEDEADEGAPRTAKQQQADDRADEFSGDAHWVHLIRLMASMLPAETSSPPVHTTSLRGLKKIHAGKVRDIYEIDPHSMLIVTTDRISAFDVVLPDPIPDKGRVLNSISNFWFERTRHIVPNHLTGRSISDVVSDPDERTLLADRAVIVKRLKTVPLEAVVRGYVIGSGWKDYQKTGAISGIKLPSGLKQAAKLPQTLFTPSTKAVIGEHDETISFEVAARLVGDELAARVRDTAISLYEFASRHARERGIIIADTKFEFAQDADGKLVLIDEVLTPDSSRFWPADTWREGTSPPSFDKQFVRDYLETLDWNKKAPGPALPPQVIAGTRAKYLEALAILTR
jgi:phosphoribosylaminoimidazole-succinocarboxamide synthase